MISKLGRGSRLALAVGLMLAFLAGSAASQQPPRQPPPGPRPGQPPGPPPGGGHPWNNDLMMRLGSDRDGFGAETVFVERAGVPSVTRMRDGRWLATFQWFPEDDRAAFDRVAVAFGDEEGKNWSKPRKVVFEGLPPQYMRPFDPTLVTLDDGRVRMYFTSTPNPRRPGDRDTTAIYSAISTDGIHYEFESGARFAVMAGPVARLHRA
ncbi:MAG TPA: hypothetical protein PKD86_16255, partial [Gemmatales bacterium]|nr:hypothetical protein [Gemmatales bacterium]